MSSAIDKLEAYQIGQDYRFARLREFEIDETDPPMGVLTMWEPPEPGGSFEYTVGVDPAWGLGKGSDRAAIHVIRNGTMHTMDTQVAEFVSEDTNVHELTPICYMIGKLYASQGREALMTVECNMGEEIVYNLRTKYNYANIFVRKTYDSIKNIQTNRMGWLTTQRTSPTLISKALQYVKQGWWDIRSPWLINEMQTIEKHEDKAKIEAAAGTHDDIFMAACIALWSAHDAEFSEDRMELAQRRELKRVEKRAAAFHALEPRETRRDYANMAYSVDDVDRDVYKLLGG